MHVCCVCRRHAAIHQYKCLMMWTQVEEKGVSICLSTFLLDLRSPQQFYFLQCQYIRPHRFPREASMVQLWVRHSKIGMRNVIRKKKEWYERDGIGIEVYCGEVLLRSNPWYPRHRPVIRMFFSLPQFHMYSMQWLRTVSWIGLSSSTHCSALHCDEPRCFLCGYII